MPSYEYGNLYVLKVTVEDVPLAGGYPQPEWKTAYIIETQGRRTAEYIGAWDDPTWTFHGKETSTPRLRLLNGLGEQGWVLHQQVAVNAPGPQWMYDLFKAQIVSYFSYIEDIQHEATREMRRRIPAIGRRRTTSAESLGGFSLTGALSLSSASISATA